MFKIFSFFLIFFTFTSAHAMLLPCSLRFFYDHQIKTKVEVLPIFPGAGYVSASLGVLSMVNPNKKIILKGAKVANQLTLSQFDVSNPQNIEVEVKEGKVVIRTKQVSDKKGHFIANVQIENLDVPKTQMEEMPTAAPWIDISNMYKKLSEVGLKYGPQFRALVEGKIIGNKGYGILQVAEDLRVNGYSIHPSILDSAFHLVGAMANRTSDKMFVPAIFGEVVYYGNTSLKMYAEVTLEPIEEKRLIFHIKIFNDNKKLVLDMRDVIFIADAF